MTGTFSQIYIHTVFAVKGRQSLIHNHWEEELYRYISGIVTNKNQKMIAINGMPDHIHFLLGIKPLCCLSDLVREIKKSSNEWINQKGLTNSPFKWQEGFGAFSHSQSSLDKVIAYIANQKEHHAQKKFREEYLEILANATVEFKEEYLFEWIEY